ncbi:NADPH-dependent ferric siderophore reductase [Tamaricihabitans halophyticus]|uniref:NADPH-dependent ferric siderophore reductase n=1 Tax=Tamaricihabitans halophyticus TaxID=1262583 RepID=A0A4R2QEY9_9PSEU|nr:siderophore-interacting protein [Tamaricihabitans halophyticus]TCP46858.1 NADPH-dependent ferric siderophore reductase [Tamaricihabitans halophyticus]
MAEARKTRQAILTVLRTERLSPHMVRVVFGGPGFGEFEPNGFTDAYVKLVFPCAGVRYPEPFDISVVRAEYPREQWPTTRTYTVRYHDAVNQELAIDFVWHGDSGLAGPWAAAAQPGDQLVVLGPGGAYAPDPTADWHLFVGDESALPAIGAALERLATEAPSARGQVVLEVADAAEEQKLVAPPGCSVTWLHRGADPDALPAAVRALEFPAGQQPQAFVHGEAGFVRALRRHLLNERGMSKEALSLSGYWRKGKNEDGWQAEKAAERAAEQAARG